MNRWIQTRVFTCLKCGEAYLHDKAYHHALFRCPKKKSTGRDTLSPSPPPPTVNGSTP